MHFLMSLALRLGRTLAELRQTMSINEMLMWAEFDRVSPISDVRGDIRNAQLVSAIFGSQGLKMSLDDALLQWHPDQRSDSDLSSSDPFGSLEAALISASS